MNRHKMNKSFKRIKPLINQSELARRMKVTPRYVGMLISGERTAENRIDQIKKILAKELGGLLKGGRF